MPSSSSDNNEDKLERKDDDSNSSDDGDDGDDGQGDEVNNSSRSKSNNKTPFVKKLKKWFVWSIFPKPVDGNKLSHWKKYDKEFGHNLDDDVRDDDQPPPPVLPIQENDKLDDFFKEHLSKVEYRVLVEQKTNVKLKESSSSSSSSDSPSALYKLYYNFYPSFGYFACKGCGNKLYRATDKIRPNDNKEKDEQKKYIIFTKDVVTKKKKKKKSDNDDDDGSSSSSSSSSDEGDDDKAEKLPATAGVTITKTSKQKKKFTLFCKRCRCFLGTNYDDCIPKKVKDDDTDNNEVIVEGKEYHCIHGICVKYIF